MAYAQVVFAQEREALAQQQVALSEDLLDTVRKRVQAGKDSPIEQGKAQIALSSSKINLADSQQALTGARIRLASTWAGTPTFSVTAWGQGGLVKPPLPEDLWAAAQSHPYVARWADEIAQAQTRKTLAQREGVPDLAVQAGFKRYEEDHDNTAVIGVALPLPVFNRNQGARQEAAFRLAQTRQLQQQALLEMSAALSETHSRLNSAYERTIGLRDQILPAAETAFQGTLTGYKQGKFGYLDVLDAHRTLFEVKRQYIEAQLDYRRTRANLEQLIGRPLDSVNAK
jgi:cobalt-zinc-cadmium efflux system outer membrane protein